MSRKRIHSGVVCKCQVCGVEFHPPMSSVGANLQLNPGLGKYCSRKCSGVGRRGPRVPLQDRFWAKVDKNGPFPADASLGNCWVWTGSLHNSGYGMIGMGKRPAMAHRLSYEWAFGPIPSGMLVRHRCDRPRCVRPDHLCLGDCVDNALDWISRGASRFATFEPRRRTKEERFWLKVDKSGPIPAHAPELGPCWIWLGAKDGKGYGKVGVGGGKSTVAAHRFSYEQAFGPIADGLMVLHRCDCPACVCPSHLWAGTQAENMQDKTAKNRSNSHRKLTEDQVREIRQRHAAGESQCSLARVFCLVQSTVHDIVHGLIWNRVDHTTPSK